MSRKAGRGDSRAHLARGSARTPAVAVGWFLFLAMVGLTPLVMGALPPQLGTIALHRASDPVVLPKVVTFLVLSCLSLLALCIGVIRGETELRWHPVLWVLVGLVGWAGVSTVFSASINQSVLGLYTSSEGLVAIFGYALIAFLAVQYVRSTSAVRSVAVVAVVSGALVSVYALVQFWGVDIFSYTDTGVRVFSTLGNPDVLGDYLLFPLALASGLALSESSVWPSMKWWGSVTLVAAALLVTGTRGAWIGGAVIVLCAIVFNRDMIMRASRRGKIVLAGIAAAVVVAAAAFYEYAQPLAGRTVAISSGVTKFSSGRSIIWLTGLRAWLTHPITGWGPDGFGRAFISAAGPEWYAIIQGLQKADNAHNFFIQTLVTLGLPGLALTIWALGQTAVASFRVTRSGDGSARALPSALWWALVGMSTALFFGLTLPPVTMWLWLTVGLLLAPISQRVSGRPTAALAVSAAVALAMALWVASWLVADVTVGWAQQQATGPQQIALFEAGVRLNPISPDYRWLYAESIADEAVAEQRAGQADAAVTMDRAIAAFDVAAAANPGDAMVRVALSNVLVGIANQQPGGEASQQAVQVAQEAVRLAPQNPGTLAALAQAYQAAGRTADAEKTARLARSISPSYSSQTLGTLGLETTVTP